MATFKYKDPETGEWFAVSGAPGPAGSTPVKGVDYFTEEDKAEIATAIIEAGGQPDWSQNDPEARDYVKNRPGGYYEKAYSVIQEETTLEFALEGNFYEAYLPFEVTSALFGSKPVVRVVFDGVEYEKAFEKYAGFEPDETIPFGIYCDVTGDALTTFYTPIEGETHTVEISILENTPVPIDAKFLPDSVKVQPDWNQNDESAPDYVKNRTHYVGAPTKATIIEEQTVTITSDGGAAQLTSSPLYFTGNETYIVNFDGVEYECIANDRGLRCSIGYDDNTNWGEDGKPESPIFSCSSYLEDNSVYLTVKTAGTYTVSIASVTHNIVQIPAMYLPNSNVMNGDGDGAVQTGQATAIGYDSHAEGWSTANGDRSHAEGFSTANGSMSHAEGSSTANGISSHAEGKSTANGWCQHTQGKYNIEDETSAHIVGNGESTPSNAHTLDWNGNAWFAGDVYVGSTSGTNKDEGSKILATRPSMTRITLSASSWDATALTQSVAVTGISADETAQIIQCSPYGASMATAVASGIYCSGQAADSLTFTCTSVPTEDIQFTVSWQDCMWIVPLISFTIVSNGVYESYQAEEGMTWEEWVNSSYNTIGVSLHDDTTAVWNSDGSKYLYYLHHSVQRTEQIVSGEYKFTTPL